MFRNARSKSSLRRLAATFVLVTTTLSGLLPTAATAAVREFHDAADAPGIDITTVRVRYGDWLRITAGHQGRIRVGQTYKYWIDTNASNPGPEYYYYFFPNSDGANLKRVDGFRDSTKQRVQCGRQWGGTADMFRPYQPVVALISGRCLGNPSRVRVSLRFVNSDGSGDGAPGTYRFYDWVFRY